MATTSNIISIVMGALQVIGLFLPVVVLTTRFVLKGLEPDSNASGAEMRENYEKQTKLAHLSVLLIITLSLSAVCMLLSLLVMFELPALILVGLILLGAGFIIFGLALLDVTRDSNIIL